MDKLIVESVEKYAFDALRALALAVIEVETGGVRGRTRYEPEYRYFYRVDYYANRLGLTKQTETVGQMTSHGVMQVMGGVFREMGFEGYWPQAGWEIDVGIKYGVAKLKSCFDKYGLVGGVAAYNAGSPRMFNGKYVNQVYVDKVLAKYNILTKLN